MKAVVVFSALSALLALSACGGQSDSGMDTERSEGAEDGDEVAAGEEEAAEAEEEGGEEAEAEEGADEENASEEAAAEEGASEEAADEESGEEASADEEDGEEGPSSSAEASEGVEAIAGENAPGSAGASRDEPDVAPAVDVATIEVAPATSGGSVGIAPRPAVGMVAPGIGGGSSGSYPEFDTCEEEFRSVSDNYCEQQYACDNDYLYTYCWEESAGTFFCECGSNGGWGSFQLTEGDTSPCEQLTEICDADANLEFSDEQVCEPDYQSASDDWCDISMRCSQTADLEGGGQAFLSEYQWVNCHEDGDATRCECSGERGYVSFDLPSGGEGLGNCNTALDLCQSVQDAETSGPANCEPRYQSSSRDWCDAEAQCSVTANVDGTDIEIHQSAWTYCQHLGDNNWQCTCEGVAQAVTFELMSEDGWDTCTNAVEVCMAQ